MELDRVLQPRVRFHDIDDQIADLKDRPNKPFSFCILYLTMPRQAVEKQDNVDQMKADIHKMELTKNTIPQQSRRNSTGNKAAEAMPGLHQNCVLQA